MAFAFDELLFDAARLELFRAGTRIQADAQVLQLLAFLIEQRHQLVSKDALLAAVWDGRALGDNVISVCVAKLRKALGGDSQRYIRNVYGRGYRFTADVRTVETLEHAPLASAGTAALDVELVGRASALSRLEQGVDRAIEGRGGLYALLGEAGIGKTRLAEAAERYALARGVEVAWGRFEDAEDTAALSGWLQLARTLKQPGPDGLPEAQAGSAWASTSRWLGELCARSGAHGVGLWVLDDLQWADRASLRLLLQLAREIAGLRLVVVLTVRDTDLPRALPLREPLEAALGHRSCERIQLSRLLPHEVERYLTQVHGPCEQGLARLVFAKSEGNPFFMVELARLLAESGPQPARTLELTGPALEIVRQSLRKLSLQTYQTLAAAAVIGRAFELPLLARVRGQGAAEVLDALEPALAAQVLVAAHDSQTGFAFGHDLTRRVLYEDLPRKQRASHHVAIARALAGSGLPAQAAADCARHWLAALPDGDAEAAIEAARVAAQAAQRIGAHGDACALLHKAREALSLLVEPAPAREAALLLELATAERAAGAPSFVEHLTEAVRVASAHALGSLLAAAGELMSGGPGTVAMSGVTATLEAARAALPVEERDARARVLAYLSSAAPYCADRAQVQALLDEASALAQGQPLAELVVLRHRLYFAGGPGDEARAEALMRSLRQHPAVQTAAGAARLMSGEFDRLLSALQRGDLALATHLLDKFGESAHAVRHAELIWHHDRIVAIMKLNAGQLAEARQHFAELAERADALGLHGRAEIYVVDLAESLRHVSPLRALPPALLQKLWPLPSDPPNVLSGRLRSLAQYGEQAGARAGLGTLSEAAVRALPPSRDYLATLCNLAFVSVAVEAHDHARLLYELLSPFSAYFSVSISFHNAGSVAAQLAELAYFLGDLPRAVEHFEQALTAHTERAFEPLATSTRIALARALRASGEPARVGRAQTLLASARADAIRLGLSALQREAESLDSQGCEPAA